MLSRIAHTTDFSSQSAVAYEHALALALAARGRLDILHVRHPGQAHEWHSFPHVRETLRRWGLLAAGDEPQDIERKLGVRVAKIEIDHADPRAGLTQFFLGHRPDLLVLSAHGWEGLERWVHSSVSEEVVRRTFVPTLLIGPHSRSLVQPSTGRLGIGRVLMPVTVQPAPGHALQRIEGMLAAAAQTPEGLRLVHVADDDTAPMADLLDGQGRTRKPERHSGPVVETIVALARQWSADLIAMPTSTRHGLFQALRGSTTSHVVAHASCPVLALPTPHP